MDRPLRRQNREAGGRSEVDGSWFLKGGGQGSAASGVVDMADYRRPNLEERREVRMNTSV